MSKINCAIQIFLKGESSNGISIFVMTTKVTTRALLCIQMLHHSVSCSIGTTDGQKTLYLNCVVQVKVDLFNSRNGLFYAVQSMGEHYLQERGRCLGSTDYPSLTVWTFSGMVWGPAILRCRSLVIAQCN